LHSQTRYSYHFLVARCLNHWTVTLLNWVLFTSLPLCSLDSDLAILGLANDEHTRIPLQDINWMMQIRVSDACCAQCQTFIFITFFLLFPFSFCISVSPVCFLDYVTFDYPAFFMVQNSCYSTYYFLLIIDTCFLIILFAMFVNLDSLFGAGNALLC